MPKLRVPRPRLRRVKAEAEESDVTLSEDGHGARMGFFQHLEELRQRLFKAMFALILGTAGGLFVARPALVFLQEPYGEKFQVLGPTGGVIAYFRVSLLIGAIITIPVITYQVLMFILPGLTRKERRVLLLSLPAITILFLVGVAFAWFVLMPPALNFLTEFQSDIFKPEFTADLYLSFVTSLIFWMGVAFETPLIFFILAILGLVTATVLLRNWRVAVVGASVAAALITPTIDPVNMFLVMGPLLTLYLLSIFLVALGRRIARVE